MLVSNIIRWRLWIISFRMFNNKPISNNLR